MILKILAVLAVLVIGFLIFVATRPAAFRYTRSFAIAAPPETLFGFVNDLRKFQEWNPWAKADPECEITYFGPDTGAGASYEWKGNKHVGEGAMTITESRPGELVRARMDFRKPFAATHTAEFTFTPEDDGKTLVTWSLHGDNKFAGKLMGVFMDCDKMCGSEFEKGLAKLKEIAE